jgi:hypothetical protein
VAGDVLCQVTFCGVTFCGVMFRGMTFCRGDVLCQVTFCGVTFCRGTVSNPTKPILLDSNKQHLVRYQ